jgi:solute carrier family 35 protein E1
MPHSTRPSSLGPGPSIKFSGDTKPSVRTSMEKFPDLDSYDGQFAFPTSPVKSNGYMNGPPPVERWQPRRDSGLRASAWGNGETSTGGKGHARQKSLSDAFRTIRTRRASVSANVHEISDALKVPLSPKLIVSSPSYEYYRRRSADIHRFCALSGICQVLVRIHPPNRYSLDSRNLQH